MARLALLALLLGWPVAAAAQPLTREEKALLAEGPISSGERAGGAALGLVVGFGSGQAVQGRYRSRGWIFTGIDATLTIVGLAALHVCLESDHDSGDLVYNEEWCHVTGGAILGLGASRVWQTLDAIIVPERHNRRLRELQERPNRDLEYLPTPPGWRSYLVPAPVGHGAVAGAALAF